MPNSSFFLYRKSSLASSSCPTTNLSSLLTKEVADHEISDDKKTEWRLKRKEALRTKPKRAMNHKLRSSRREEAPINFGFRISDFEKRASSRRLLRQTFNARNFLSREFSPHPMGRGPGAVLFPACSASL